MDQCPALFRPIGEGRPAERRQCRHRRSTGRQSSAARTDRRDASAAPDHNVAVEHLRGRIGNAGDQSPPVLLDEPERAKMVDAIGDRRANVVGKRHLCETEAPASSEAEKTSGSPYARLHQRINRHRTSAGSRPFARRRKRPGRHARRRRNGTPRRHAPRACPAGTLPTRAKGGWLHRDPPHVLDDDDDDDCRRPADDRPPRQPSWRGRTLPTTGPRRRSLPFRRASAWWTRSASSERRYGLPRTSIEGVRGPSATRSSL